MSYGLLKLPEEGKPLMVFQEDWEEIRNAIMRGDEQPNGAFFTNGFVNAAGEGDITKEGVDLHLEPIPSGLFYNGVFAKTTSRVKLDNRPYEEGVYFVYATVDGETVSRTVVFPNDPHTREHKYDDEEIVISFETTESVDYGILLAKITVLNNEPIDIYNSVKEQLHLKPSHLSSLINLFNAEQFTEDTDGKITYNPEVESNESSFADKGIFPYFFGISDLSALALKINPDPDDRSGHYSFFGGNVFIFDRDYSLPDFTSNSQTIVFSLSDPNNISEDDTSSEPIASVTGDRIVFYLEIVYSRDANEDIDLTSLSLRVVDDLTFNSDFPAYSTRYLPDELPLETEDSLSAIEDSPLETEDSSSAIEDSSSELILPIKLCVFTKSSDDNWVLQGEALHNEDLLEDFNVLSLDCVQSSHFAFTPQGNYIVRFEGYYKNQDITVETVGNRGDYNISRWECSKDGNTHDLEQASIYVKHSGNEREVLRFHCDSTNYLSVVSSLHEKDWTQKRGVGIGRIHGELVHPDDALEQFPLSKPCGSDNPNHNNYLRIEDYPLYADWAAPIGEDGTRKLTDVATNLGINVDVDSITDKPIISLPDFSKDAAGNDINGIFPRFVMDDVGRYETDEFKSHRHRIQAEDLNSNTKSYRMIVQSTNLSHDNRRDYYSTISYGGDETRPKNRGFYPLIKVR